MIHVIALRDNQYPTADVFPDDERDVELSIEAIYLIHFSSAQHSKHPSSHFFATTT